MQQPRLKVFFIIVVLTLSLAAAPAPPQSHPLSEIVPVDVDLNMSDQRIENVSQIQLNNGIGDKGLLLDGYTISGQGQAQRLSLDYQNDEWDIENSDLDLNGNNISGFFETGCGDNQAVKKIYGNGSFECGQAGGGGLSDVLQRDNTTQGTDISVDNSNITSSTGNVSVGTDLKVFGDIWLKGDGNSQTVDSPYQNLSKVLELGNSAGTYDINLNSNALRDVGALYSDSNIQCGPDEFLNGNGDCVEDSFSPDTDNQNLQEVLAQGNSSGTYDIDMNGNDVNNVNCLGDEC